MLAQYVKDFSFENPNAPRSLQPSNEQPQINIQINVNASPLQSDFEIDLKIEGKAELGNSLLFA
ncbi:protein-export chaperone SecB, partial [Vibrio parahaemolyticus]|nr:protein-export chaperone SecB [Vibrio parahaemolyticus]